MTLDFDVVVIGAGIAGMTSSLYLKRAGFKVAIIESSAPGGQINKTNSIENYPGFLKIDGPSLAFNVFSQIKDVNYKYGNVLKIIDEKDYKIIKTDKEEIKCKGIIIATGRKNRELGLENEKKLLNKGISYCCICDGFLYKDKEVAIYGNNNHTIEEALYLSKICKKVYLITKLEYNNESLIIKNNEITKINEIDNKISSIELDNNEKIEISGLFIVDGYEPHTEFIDFISKENNYILVDNKMKTSMDYIYACGDVIKKDFYQISIAVGEASTSALNLIKDLNL